MTCPKLTPAAKPWLSAEVRALLLPVYFCPFPSLPLLIPYIPGPPTAAAQLLIRANFHSAQLYSVHPASISASISASSSTLLPHRITARQPCACCRDRSTCAHPRSQKRAQSKHLSVSLRLSHPHQPLLCQLPSSNHPQWPTSSTPLSMTSSRPTPAAAPVADVATAALAPVVA